MYGRDYLSPTVSSIVSESHDWWLHSVYYVMKWIKWFIFIVLIKLWYNALTILLGGCIQVMHNLTAYSIYSLSGNVCNSQCWIQNSKKGLPLVVGPRCMALGHSLHPNTNFVLILKFFLVPLGHLFYQDIWCCKKMAKWQSQKILRLT